MSLSFHANSSTQSNSSTVQYIRSAESCGSLEPHVIPLYKNSQFGGVTTSSCVNSQEKKKVYILFCMEKNASKYHPKLNIVSGKFMEEKKNP